MSTTPLLSVVIPAFNEADHLGDSLKEIASWTRRTGMEYELVVVDDGSSDATWSQLVELARLSPEIRGLRLSRNFGKEKALCAGLEAARGDAIIVMDADLQHPPKLIPKMVEIWRSGEADVVEAVKKRRSRESAPYRLAARGFYGAMEWMTGFQLQNGSDFKLLDRKVVKAWSKLGEHHVFFRGLTSWVGFRVKRIHFHVADRAGGTTKWTFRQLTGLATGAVVSFSSMPLRIVWATAGLFLIFAAMLSLRALYLWLIGGAQAGFTTVIILQLIIGFAILTSLGVLGEYIGKIFDEVKKRPRFLVMETTRENDESGST